MERRFRSALISCALAALGAMIGIAQVPAAGEPVKLGLIDIYSGGFSFTSTVCAPVGVAVIPSTARPATTIVILHTDLFMLSPLRWPPRVARSHE